MTRGEALRAVRLAAQNGRVVFTGHARERMVERNLRAASVVNALEHAARIGPSSDHPDAWLVTGPALSGQSLSVVVAIVEGVVVVTVWRNRR